MAIKHAKIVIPADEAVSQLLTQIPLASVIPDVIRNLTQFLAVARRDAGSVLVPDADPGSGITDKNGVIE